MDFRPCVVIPYYNHEHAIGATLDSLAPHDLPCFLVDDGSDQTAAAAADHETDKRESVRLIRLPENSGKGSATEAGLRAAFDAGFTHAIQIDADGQHNADDIPKMLAAAVEQPAALVTGIPIYDDSVPALRYYARYLTHVWVWINTLSLELKDSMCGFRVYPLASSLQVFDEESVGRFMDFDTEILVRLHWRGVPVIQIPTEVTYPLDGVSHFRGLDDNLRISRMHARLFMGMLWRLPRLLWQRIRGTT